MKQTPRRKFTQEYKDEIVQLVHNSGKTVAKVAREMDLTESVLRHWVKQSDIDKKRNPNGPLTSEERAEMARLRRELKTVTMERDFLKKAAAFFARTPK